MRTIRAVLAGFHYAVKNFNQLQDHHWHHYPGANWYDRSTQNTYRKSIDIGRKYMLYRHEILLLTLMSFTLFLWFFGW